MKGYTYVLRVIIFTKYMMINSQRIFAIRISTFNNKMTTLKEF